MRMKNFPGRIGKPEARRRWENNEPFVIVPCKCSPYTPDGKLTDMAYVIDPAEAKIIHRTFDHYFDSYSYYNCNHVTGMYPAFYVPKK